MKDINDHKFSNSDQKAVAAVLNSTIAWRIVVTLGLGWTAVGHDLVESKNDYIKKEQFFALERRIDRMTDAISALSREVSYLTGRSNYSDVPENQHSDSPSKRK